MKFTLSFQLDNDSFSGDALSVELARVLNDLAETIGSEDPDRMRAEGLSGRVRDLNGNRIGWFRIEGE